MDRLDAVVIGAGVVGLAVARALALAGREVVVLEAADAIGTETSSRNSEVIHAGIYYPPGSLKARLCVAGKHALYHYCDERGDPLPALRQADRGHRRERSSRSCTYPSAGRGERGRPTCGRSPPPRRARSSRSCVASAAYLSPSTGIVDSHAFMLALQGDAEAHGATVAFKSPVTGGAVRDDGIEIATGGDEPLRVRARTVVNSGGFHAQRIAASLAGFPAAHVPPTYYAKGNYYSLVGKSPFSRLVYPMPNDGRPRGAHHHRPRRPGALRTRRRVDRRDRLRRRPAPRRRLLRRDPRVLAGLADGRARARLFRDPTEDRAGRRTRRRTSSWRGRATMASRVSSTSSASNRPG